MIFDWRKGLLIGAALGVPGTAIAQSQGQVPTREQVNPPVPTRDDRAGNVSVDSSGAFQRGPCPLENSDLRTTIPSVAFARAGGEPIQPELVPVLAEVRVPQGEQPVRVVCDIRDQANAALRRARYVATVQIPPQRLDGGTEPHPELALRRLVVGRRDLRVVLHPRLGELVRCLGQEAPHASEREWQPARVALTASRAFS